MTFQQLRLVLEAAETGSISAAAENLSISQPNASLSIKKLEGELGYYLFRREGGGIFPTEQGYRFLEHAKSLLDEDAAIRSIGKEAASSRLKLGAMNFTPAVDAFIRFCNEKKDVPHGDYTCINTSSEIGVRFLKERKLDIIISVLLKEMIPLMEKNCRENRLELIKIGTIPICVRLRKNHPLIADGTLDGSAKGFQSLSAFPYVEYVHLEHLMNEYNQVASVPFGCSYKIFVDERDSRLKMLQETDAYNVGIQLSESRMKQYGLVSFPTGREAHLFTCIRKGDENLPDIERYTELLLEESSPILSKQ